MNVTIEAQIKCPFYIRESANIICCEGVINNTCMTTKFINRAAKMDYVKKHCLLETGGTCPMALNLYEKYRLLEEKEEREKAARRAMSKTG